MKKFILNQNGVSILMGVVMAAVLSGAALIGTRLLEDQKSSVKTADSRGSVEQLHEAISSILQNKDDCGATFTYPANTIEGTPTTIGASMAASVSKDFRYVTTSNGTIAFEANTTSNATGVTYFNGSVLIKKMNLTYPAVLTNQATLTIDYERYLSRTTSKSGKGVGGSVIRKTIPITFSRNASLNFDSCFATEDTTNLVQEFCQEYGDAGNTGTYFTWDATTNTCKPKDQTCAAGSFFVGFDATGNKVCRGFDGWIDFSTIVDNSSPPDCGGASSVKFEVTAGNKIKATCSGTERKCLDVTSHELGMCIGSDIYHRFTTTGGSGQYEMRKFRIGEDSGWSDYSGGYFTHQANQTWTIQVRDKNDTTRMTSWPIRTLGCGVEAKGAPPRCNASPTCLDMTFSLTDSACGYGGDPTAKWYQITSTTNSGYVYYQHPYDRLGGPGATGGDGPPQRNGGTHWRADRTYYYQFYDTADPTHSRKYKVTTNACGVTPTVEDMGCASDTYTALTVSNISYAASCYDGSNRWVYFNISGGSGTYLCTSYNDLVPCVWDAGEGKFRVDILIPWGPYYMIKIADANDLTKFRNIELKVNGCATVDSQDYTLPIE